MFERRGLGIRFLMLGFVWFAMVCYGCHVLLRFAIIWYGLLYFLVCYALLW